MSKDLNTIDALTLLRLQNTGLGQMSDEEVVKLYFKTRSQMAKAYVAWRKKQPVKIV